MGWLSALFATSSNRLRNGQTLSSTHEAFSLPTSSPTAFGSHPDAFNPDSINIPDPESAASTTYTYPPRGGGVYGYVPTSAGMGSRPASASLLPTHMDALHTPFSPSTAIYPPLSKTWARLHSWLNREYPELGDTLNYGILPLDLSQLEMQFGFALPAVVRESYLCCDGQEPESSAGCSEGLFFGMKLLPLEDVLEEWRIWRDVDDNPDTGANQELRDSMQSIPPTWVRKEYSQRGWIPLISDKAGNYVGVDVNPGEGGSVGQVIVFGRDFDTKVVLWRGDGPTGWAKWLANFVDELEAGEGYEIGGNDTSDDSEDDVGYESYYHDGRGQGDGGGDNGAGGGLRLTGEYRGWTVFEAWADRSVKKWRDAGVIADTPLITAGEESKGKGVDNDLGETDTAQGIDAEAPIPVLTVSSEPNSSPTTVTNHPRSFKRDPSAHASATTKPPAPLPVELPTQNDIDPIPSPIRTHSSFDEDLESGLNTGMREVSREETGKMLPRRTGTAQSSIDSTIALTPHAITKSLVTSSSSETDSPPIPRVIPPRIIPDLLAGSTPSLETLPIQPSPSPKVEIPQLIFASEAPSASESSAVPDTPEADDIDASAVEEADEEFDPNTTIRLVGGGGTTGILDASTSAETTNEVEDPTAPTAASAIAVENSSTSDVDSQSVNSVTSESSSSKKGGKLHKKTKSGLAGLKKLGLGRKRDSIGSVKDIVPK